MSLVATTSFGLPLADPQFWAASALVAGVAALALRRIVRSSAEESDSACASCPKVKPPEPGPGLRGVTGKLPIVALIAASLAQPAAAERVERQVQAMGTTVRVEVEAADRGAALGLAEAALAAIEATEQRLSTWRSDSELAAFNRARDGESVAISRATLDEVAEALACAELSGGSFDPTVGALVAAWGLRSGGRIPAEHELVAARARTGAGRIAVDRQQGTLRQSSPVEIEEGGFGKGAALDRALEAIAAASGGSSGVEVLLDFGGQVAWQAVAGDLRIELADPRSRRLGAFELSLRPLPALLKSRGSLATSGNGVRGLRVEGLPVGHLLDPRTGSPAADFGSVSVLAPSALLADCLSTALFVMGPERGLEWLAEHPGRFEAVYLIAEADSISVRASRGLADSLSPLGEPRRERADSRRQIDP